MWTGSCSPVLHWSPCVYSAYSASFSHLNHPTFPLTFLISLGLGADLCKVTKIVPVLISPGCICALGEWRTCGLSINVCWPYFNCWSLKAWVLNVGRECSECACNMDEACERVPKKNQGGSRRRTFDWLMNCLTWWVSWSFVKHDLN